MSYRNNYNCPRCDHKWEDVWDSAVDDECPKCAERAISPFMSEDLKALAAKIAQKNDTCRITFLFCKVVMTEGVANGPNREEVITAVRSFTSNMFTPANDPHGEHDFGQVEVNGTKYFWKFDYYDASYQYFQEDGNRVLTIMRADEY